MMTSTILTPTKTPYDFFRSGDASYDIDYYKVYEAICRGLDHEAKVMGDRIAWPIQYSAALFGGSAVLLGFLLTTNSPDIRALFCLVMAAIAATGIYFSWRSHEGVLAAQEQFAYHKAAYWASEPEFTKRLLPRPFGDESADNRGNAAARTFAPLMFVSWTVAFLAELSLAAMFHFHEQVCAAPWLGSTVCALAGG